jgi:hypothetical protein
MESRDSKFNLGKRITVILVAVIMIVIIVTFHTLSIVVQATSQLLITSCTLDLFIVVEIMYNMRYTNL